MPDHTLPGVYIAEVDQRAATVVPRASAVPAFIGCTERAVGPSGERLTGVPTRLTAWGDYEAAFGRSAPSLDDVPAAILPHAIRLYFENGGGPCYVHSLGPFGSARGPDWSAALVALEAVEEVTLLLFPDAVWLEPREHATVVNAALASAARTRTRFVLADVPRAWPGATDTISAVDARFRAHLTNDAQLLQYGAAYFPHVTVTGIVGPAGTKQVMQLPPSAAMAGLVVATDRASGPWKAPVNVALSSVLAPAIAVNDAQQPSFNVDPVSGKSINVIRALPGRGVRPWAGRTLAGNDAEYRYISVRRTVTHVESSIRRALAPFVFEPNDVATWQRVQAMVDDFLQALWRAGALQGARPRDAYAVRIGVGTTMTEQDVRDGVLHLQVLLALVRPAEFIAVGVTQRMPVP